MDFPLETLRPAGAAHEMDIIGSGRKARSHGFESLARIIAGKQERRATLCDPCRKHRAEARSPGADV
jgi:hypothetical protein